MDIRTSIDIDYAFTPYSKTQYDYLVTDTHIWTSILRTISWRLTWRSHGCTVMWLPTTLFTTFHELVLESTARSTLHSRSFNRRFDDFATRSFDFDFETQSSQRPTTPNTPSQPSNLLYSYFTFRQNHHNTFLTASFIIKVFPDPIFCADCSLVFQKGMIEGGSLYMDFLHF